MKALIALVSAALIALPSLLASSALADDPATRGDAARLRGKWSGKGGPDDAFRMEIRFEGDTVAMTLVAPDGRKRTGRGTFAVDEKADPRGLDLKDFQLEQEKEPRGAPPFIYEFKGKTLRLCGADSPGSPRPAAFKNAGSGKTTTMLFELTREPAQRPSAP